ncbi:MAG: HAD family hydrolase [Verrucomicrobia bacterium]|nr:HAD family hydrolase [Verrucomicrobiota bacterium]
MAIRALLFDLDDTLAVDEAVSHETFAHTAAVASSRFGVDPARFAGDAMAISRELWAEGECRPFCRSIGISAFECLWGGFTGESAELTALRHWSQNYRKEVFAKALAAQPQGEGIPSDAAEFLAAEFASTRRARQRLLPGARELMTELASTHRLALLTNGAPDLQREKIAASGLGSFFHAIAVSGEYGIGKPKPEIFHRLLGELGVTPEESVMVGNSLERDIAGARNAGIRSIWIRVPGSEEQADVTPDYTITSLAEIPAILSAISDLGEGTGK